MHKNGELCGHSALSKQCEAKGVEEGSEEKPILSCVC